MTLSLLLLPEDMICEILHYITDTSDILTLIYVMNRKLTSLIIKGVNCITDGPPLPFRIIKRLTNIRCSKIPVNIDCIDKKLQSLVNFFNLFEVHKSKYEKIKLKFQSNRTSEFLATLYRFVMFYIRKGQTFSGKKSNFLYNGNITIRFKDNELFVNRSGLLLDPPTTIDVVLLLSRINDLIPLRSFDLTWFNLTILNYDPWKLINFLVELPGINTIYVDNNTVIDKDSYALQLINNLGCLIHIKSKSPLPSKKLQLELFKVNKKLKTFELSVDVTQVNTLLEKFPNVDHIDILQTSRRRRLSKHQSPEPSDQLLLKLAENSQFKRIRIHFFPFDPFNPILKCDKFLQLV